ncbi:hypothetical protein CNQ84_00625 [Pseudomonas abyssi]|uniref:Holin n=1 Tax=Pseudomonas abyssi TaxID=170540 RepID=A0A2A3MM87_9PSED|nr:putative holin [Pseudomonas abyssi]PBK05918.1 hypothetical protein CNQ84_00625 [Pseudomonas abyssi]
MTDISSGSIAAAGLVGVSAASLVPGIDLEALIGAFAGALFFMVMSKDLSWRARAGNFLLSWVGGYFFAAESVAREWSTTSALPAMLGGLFIVAVCVSILEFVQTGKAPAWLSIIPGFGKK